MAGEAAESRIHPSRAAYAKALAPYLAALEAVKNETIRVEVFRALGGDPPAVGAVDRAVARLGEVIREAQMTVDVASRQMVLEAADRFRRSGLAREVKAIAEESPVGLPAVSFPEAVADIMAREPRLARSAEEVARAYNEDHGFALARASSVTVTRRVQDAVAKAIQTGKPVDAAVRSIRATVAAAGEDMADWTRAYAETVFRTNLSTAYSAGRFREMADPAVAYAIGALMFDGPTDAEPAGSSRRNHVAAVGLIAAPTDPVWDKLAPPLGWSCRHSLSLVPWGECRRRRLVLPDGTIRPARVPPGAHADAGFRHTGRPDIAIYGSG